MGNVLEVLFLARLCVCVCVSVCVSVCARVELCVCVCVSMSAVYYSLMPLTFNLGQWLHFKLNGFFNDHFNNSPGRAYTSKCFLSVS